MNKHRYIRFFHWILIICAYSYIIYQLAVFDDYAALWQQFTGAHTWQHLSLLVCFALFPLNIWLEARKWQCLMRGVEPMSMREAQRQVCFGIVGGFVTPYRAGDYPARVMLLRDKNHRLSGITMALAGSISLTTVIVLAGLPSLCIFFAGDTLRPLWTVFFAAFLCVLFLALLPWLIRLLARIDWRKPKLKELLQQLASMSYATLLRVLWLSFLRYLCFSLQMALALCFCGADMSLSDMFIALPLYYLLVTLTPNLPAADLGIRGGWAVFVFPHWGCTPPAAAMATICMWLINTLAPLLLATLITPPRKAP